MRMSAAVMVAMAIKQQRPYLAGFFISETMEKLRGQKRWCWVTHKPLQPARVYTMPPSVEPAAAIVGVPKITRSFSQGPVWGAAAGRSWTATAIINVKTEERVSDSAP